MAFCNQCGAQLAEGTKFCPKCGTATGAAATPTPPPPPQEPAEPVQQPTVEEQAQDFRTQQEQHIAGSIIGAMNNVADTTAEYDPKDIEQNKVMALLSYFGPLVLIPIFGAKGSKFARFHANQGLILLIACVLYGIAYNILSSIILAISWRLYSVVSLLGLVGIAFTVWAVIGIINSLSGKAKELPFIGKYRLLK